MMVELTTSPSVGRLFGKALLASTLRRGRAGDTLPDTELILRDVGVDADKLAAYNRVCGYRLGAALPPTYPHILAFPLGLRLMTDPAFPFPPTGIVHLGNRIEQRRPVAVTERLNLVVRAAGLRPHDRGVQFDMLAEAWAEGELVWTGTSTYLRKERTAADGKEPAAPPVLPLAPDAVWRVPPDTGRRYAAVSGDHNPIHTSTLAAKLFGFPRRIAHGMWTKARCLAALEGRLPAAFVVDVRFKRPLLLPSTVAFTSDTTADGWTFGVYRPKDGRQHLDGSVTWS